MTTIRYSLRLAASLLLGVLAGCATPKFPPTMIDSSYGATDRIAFQVKKVTCGGVCDGPFGPVLVASLANVDQLQNSSTFGRISSEQISSRLVQDGFKVVEARMTNAFVVRPSGEFILSESVRDLAQQQNAAVVLVGTYAPADDQAYVSLKLIRVSDNVIIAASDYIASLDQATAATIFKSPDDRASNDELGQNPTELSERSQLTP